MRIKKREKVNQPTTPSSAAVPSSSSFQSRLHLLHTTFVPFHHFQPRRPLREFALGPFARVFPVPWELCPGSSLKFALISTSFVASATSLPRRPLSIFLFSIFFSAVHGIVALLRLYNVLAGGSHKFRRRLAFSSSADADVF